MRLKYLNVPVFVILPTISLTASRGVDRRAREMTVPLCSTFVRLNLQYCFQGPQNPKDMLELVQKKALKLIRGLEYLSYKRKVEGVGLVSIGDEKALKRPHWVFPVPKGAYRKVGEGLFVREFITRKR